MSFKLSSNPPTTAKIERISFALDGKLSFLVAGTEKVDGTPIRSRLRENVVDVGPALDEANQAAGTNLTEEQLHALLEALSESGAKQKRQEA